MFHRWKTRMSEKTERIRHKGEEEDDVREDEAVAEPVLR